MNNQWVAIKPAPISKTDTGYKVDGAEDIIESFESNIDSSSFMKPKKDMNIASGCPLFISKEKFLS